MAIQGCDCKEETNIGQVVDKFVKQTSSDDYFYAVVWTGTEAKEVGYESTAFGACSICGCRGSASIDAHPLAMAAYRAYCAQKDAVEAAHDMHYGRLLPRKDESYTVVRGRKVAKGTTGVCAGIRQTMYGHIATLRTAAGCVQVDTKNLAPAV